MTAWTVTHEDDVAILALDLPGEPVNKLTPDVVAEFEELFFGQLARDPEVKAVVLISGKQDNFLAGADIDQFLLIKTAEDGTVMDKRGQDLINRVEGYPKPTVVAIHGACMGAGLEMALACWWRIATDHPKTQLGLPEVQIGILPGAGGCQRLPRTIGVRAALDMILAGKAERAAKAYKIGIVDELVHPAILRETAVAAARRLIAAGKRPEREAKGGLAGALLDSNPLGRRLVYRQAKAELLKKTRGHYPAPLAALEAVQTGLEQGMEEGLRVEREKFGQLAVSEVCRNLIAIFFATNALKKDDGVSRPVGAGFTPPGRDESRPYVARKVNRLGVVGSGFMGSSIAGTAVAQAGTEVRLKDSDLSRVGKGLKAALGVLDYRFKRRRISKYEYERQSALLSGAGDWSGFSHADMVIEAVFEDLEVKRQVMSDIEAVVDPSAVIATNTSTIPISDIGALMRYPQRFLGMHYFSPVDRMPLLEVIPGANTAPSTIATAVQYGRKMGKTVIVVADSPGFWVNRILSPYMNEAGLLLAEGVPIELIDKAMTQFGFPVGPVTLLDEVGLDIAVKAGGVMYHAFGERMAPSGVVPKMVEDGRLGRKVGKGFYLYEDGKKGAVDESAYAVIGVKPLAGIDELVVRNRLAYTMLNEAAMAHGEGVVRSPRDGDIGAIFGIGFPPFRGGPLRMIDSLGATQVVKTLEGLVLAHGTRFEPCEALREMARTGARYYPA